MLLDSGIRFAAKLLLLAFVLFILLVLGAARYVAPPLTFVVVSFKAAVYDRHAAASVSFVAAVFAGLAALCFSLLSYFLLLLYIACFVAGMIR